MICMIYMVCICCGVSVYSVHGMCAVCVMYMECMVCVLYVVCMYVCDVCGIV